VDIVSLPQNLAATGVFEATTQVCLHYYKLDYLSPRKARILGAYLASASDISPDRTRILDSKFDTSHDALGSHSSTQPLSSEIPSFDQHLQSTLCTHVYAGDLSLFGRQLDSEIRSTERSIISEHFIVHQGTTAKSTELPVSFGETPPPHAVCESTI
jgi:hypothetical protein